MFDSAAPLGGECDGAPVHSAGVRRERLVMPASMMQKAESSPALQRLLCLGWALAVSALFFFVFLFGGALLAGEDLFLSPTLLPNLLLRKVVGRAAEKAVGEEAFPLGKEVFASGRGAFALGRNASRTLLAASANHANSVRLPRQLLKTPSGAGSKSQRNAKQTPLLSPGGGAFVADEDEGDLADALRREGWVCAARERETTLQIPAEWIRELRQRPAALVSDRVRLLLETLPATASPLREQDGASAQQRNGVSPFEAGLTPRSLLTAEAYAQADRRLAEAVREDRLTKAVRVGGQYIYPWPEFSKDDREQLRLMADQLKWLPKWIRNHRNAQRVHQGALGAHLPVVRPKFADKYGGPGSALLGAAPGVRYTWLGHASGLVTVDGLKVLIDPVLSDDLVGAMQAWVKRLLTLINTRLCGSLGERLRPAPTRISELPPDVHLVILSHNHPDHIMEGDVQKLCRTYRGRFRDLFWYVPEGVAWFLVRHGCPAQRVFEFTWGESRTLSCFRRKGRYACADGEWSASEGATAPEGDARVDSFSVTFVGNVHWSGRSTSKTDHNTSLWGSFAIAGPKHRFYYGGDTSFFKPSFDEFKKVGRLLGPFHLAALPIGAYEPNDDLRYQHVRPSEALQIFRDIKAEVAVGVHWGTFRLSAEKFFDPLLELECALLDVPLAQCRGDGSPAAVTSGGPSQQHSSGAEHSLSEAAEAAVTQSASEATATGVDGRRGEAGRLSRARSTSSAVSSGAVGENGRRSEELGDPHQQQPQPPHQHLHQAARRPPPRREVSGRVNSASLESSPEDSVAFASAARHEDDVVIGSTVTAAVLLEPEPDLHNEDFAAFEAEHESGFGGEGGSLTKEASKSVSARLFSKVVTAFPQVASVGWTLGLQKLTAAGALKPTRLARGRLQLSSSWSDPFMHPSNFRR